MEQNARSNRSWIEQNTSTCPTCEFKTEKSGGCNHITCINCFTHYCYLCGENMGDNNPIDHYKDQTKTCHGKYITDINDANIINDDWEV